MIVRLTAQAETDLECIGDYIAKDNPSRALSFVIELRGAFLSLAEIALAFPGVPRYERHGIRRRVYGNYSIFYRIDDNQVIVVHILHCAMDYLSMLP